MQKHLYAVSETGLNLHLVADVEVQPRAVLVLTLCGYLVEAELLVESHYLQGAICPKCARAKQARHRRKGEFTQ